MAYVNYRLKITAVSDGNVFRVVEIGGRRSLADLSGLILDAFGFDREHLYMFRLKRKPYDPDGIYHPAGRKGRRADRVRLKDVEPAARRWNCCAGWRRRGWSRSRRERGCS